MSLICAETKRDIKYGSPLHAAAREDWYFFSALSEGVLKQIPEEEIRPIPAESVGEGINIHLATSSLNPTGSYTISDFTLGKFLFSISAETAKKISAKPRTNARE